MRGIYGSAARAAIVVSLAWVGPANAAEVRCDVIVTGTNTSPADVTALTDAVNGDHHGATEVTVCMEGEFDFGGSGRLVIDPTVANAGLQGLSIRGIGADKPTVYGGNQAFAHPLSSPLPRLRISNVRFVNPSVTAISIFRGTERIEISDVDIEGVIPLVLPMFGVAIREGILVNSNLLTTPLAAEVLITGNYVDGGVYDPVDDLTGVNAGIAVLGRFGTGTGDFTGPVTISRNVVKNWSGSAIAALSLASARITHNTVEPGSFANAITGCALPTGLGAAAGVSLAGVTSSVVRSNVITLVPAATGNGAAACNVGIIVIGGTAAGAVSADDNDLDGNRFLGEGSYALAVGTPVSTAETGNFVHGNNVEGFVGTSLLLGDGASGNVFTGHFPLVEGNLAANSITGM